MSFPFNHIYSNGCSFMWGDGLSKRTDIFKFFDETKDIDISEPVRSNGNPYFTNYDWVREKYNFPGRIAEYYNVKVTNESIYGGSLKRVIRKTYNWIINNREAVKDTLFILEWPIGARNEVYLNHHKRYVNYTSSFDNFDGMHKPIFNMLVNDFAPNMFSEGITFLEDLHGLIGLLSFLDTLNAKYYLILDEYPLPIYKEETKQYIKEKSNIEYILNTKLLPYSIKFYSKARPNAPWIMDGVNENVGETYSLVNYYFHYEDATLKHDTNGVEGDGHPSFRGAKIIAEQIINRINNDYELL